ncbi:hypothetical protein [Paenibacillus sp. 1P03SA]|uniref:hypothetical protein n=1 Tax=Paenibacillus sp. 1P03SA TaxID=3132294 RepID=UPI0039A0A827
MQIIRGVTYWGIEGSREVERRVNVIETRSSGTQYINWTRIKKDGSEGKTQWTEREKFAVWVKGVYELENL